MITEVKYKWFQGIRILLKNAYIDVGGIKELYIIFNSRSDRKQIENLDICEHFSIEVKGGASIPITVKAQVNLPLVTYEQASIDFGEVKCGQKAMKSILLKNT